MKGEELFLWAKEDAQVGDEVTIEFEDREWFSGTVGAIDETEDGRNIYFEDDEYNRCLILDGQRLEVHVNIGGQDE